MHSSDDEASIADDVAARTRSHMSGHLSVSARLFSDQATAAETGAPAELTQAYLATYRANCLGAVVLGACTLEAYINDTLIKLSDPPRVSPPHLPSTFGDAVFGYWSKGDRDPTLAKFQKVLGLAGLPGFDKTSEPYFGAETLILWRNSLVHFKASWDEERERHQSLESRLAGRFPLSPFTDESQPLFPHRVLSAGGANWALQACTCLIEDFATRLGIPPSLPMTVGAYRRLSGSGG